MTDILQIVGAILVLAGFFASQIGAVDARSLAYLIVNALGSGVLAVLALLGREWGFLLLEGVWCLVALASLLGVLGRARRQRPHLLRAQRPPSSAD
ncbi:CBU_0592 family membrane protein [Actinocatenispora comari]|jgi:hypothetical protein|uniref:CBU-0592-like domain-containing protein n=1 Tax=Actinocatenispora comari TaxID=2807577 RepID=A0A8J4AC08_9ACTN|nr:hypothetical protein [Actinocatenispora comari]GIL25953.1 hypothetical protein NUM_12070 [Actinocatenispora comari]